MTESFDTDEVLGVCGVALGHFGPEETLLDGSGTIITGYWRNRWLDYEQARWAYLFDPGLVGEARAKAWADEVWDEPEEEGDQDAGGACAG